MSASEIDNAARAAAVERVRQVVRRDGERIEVVASGVGKSVKTIWNWIEQGAPTIPCGNETLIDLPKLPAWLAEYRRLMKERRARRRLEKPPARGRGRPKGARKKEVSAAE